VFPYFYVPYDDDLPADPGAAHSYLRDLAQGIEIAMRSSTQARCIHGRLSAAVACLVSLPSPRVARVRPLTGYLMLCETGRVAAMAIKRASSQGQSEGYLTSQRWSTTS
jgi:hypothetical protein